MSELSFESASRNAFVSARTRHPVNASVQISALDAGDEASYVAWLYAQPKSMVYFAPCFRRFLEQVTGGFGHTLVARRGGRIVGALPYVGKRVDGIGAVYNSQPWYGSHGGCILARETERVARAALLAEYRALVERDEGLFSNVIISPWENAYLDIYVRELRPRARDARIGQMTELPTAGPDLEQRLERVLRQKTRNLVRKSRNQGFSEQVRDDDEAWQVLFHTHAANMHAIAARPKPESHFRALRGSLPPENRRLSLAFCDGIPVAAMLLITFNRVVEYVTPATKPEYRSRQPLSFLIWQAMLDACSKGFMYWNWGGTWAGQSALHHFKAGFGATDHPYSYFVSASEAGLHQLHRCRDRLFESFPNFYLYPLTELGR